MIYYVEDDVNIRDLAIYALKQAGFQGFPEADEFFRGVPRRAFPTWFCSTSCCPRSTGRFSAACATTRPRSPSRDDADGEGDRIRHRLRGLDAGADDYLASPSA